MKVLLFGVALLFSLYAPQRVSSLPGGAPAPACATLTPSPSAHGSPQSGNIPYSIDLSPFNINGTLAYIPGNTYTLTLMPNATVNPNVTTFRGFLVQARRMADDSISNSATFAVTTGSTNTQLSACTPSTAGITHNGRTDKTSVNFDWTAPPAGTGPIRFGFAVVQTRPTHWANQRTMVIAENGATGGATRLTGVGFWSLMMVALAAAIKTAL